MKANARHPQTCTPNTLIAYRAPRRSDLLRITDEMFTAVLPPTPDRQWVMTGRNGRHVPGSI